MLTGDAKRVYMREYMRSYRKKEDKTPRKTLKNVGVKPLDPTPAPATPKPMPVIASIRQVPIWIKGVHKPGDMVRKWDESLRRYVVVTL
jgi:hypothetical protein